MTAKISGLKLARVGGASSDIVATWSPPSGNVTKAFVATKGGKRKSNTKAKKNVTLEYEVTWYYTVLDSRGIIKKMPSTTNTAKNCRDSFPPPDNAVKVFCSVRPVAREYTCYTGSKSATKSSGKWYSGASCAFKGIGTGAGTPDAPEIDSVEMDGRTLTVKVASDDPYVEKVTLCAYLNGTLTSKQTKGLDPRSTSTCSFALTDCAYSGRYSFGAFITNERGDTSPETDRTQEYLILPATPTVPPTVSARESGAAFITLPHASSDISEWTLQYVDADNREEATVLLNSSEEPSSMTSSTNEFLLRGLEANKSYYFRYKVANATGECDGWSPVTTTGFVYGTKPEKPSIWTGQPVYMTTEVALLCWAHNSEDGSEQAACKVMYAIGEGEPRVETVHGSTSTLSLLLGDVPDGASVTWCAMTQSAAGVWSDWCDTSSFKVWEPPTVCVGVPETASRMPICITVDAESQTQAPVVIDIEVLATQAHSLMFPDGSERLVQAGEVVFTSHNVSVPDPFEVQIGPGDAFFQDGQEYEVRATCAMSSGLSCSNSNTFLYDIDEASYTITADIRESGDYAVEIVPYALNPTDDGSLDYAEGVTFSVLRFETDGTLTPLVRNMPNDGTFSLVDRHAMLTRQSYRVIALDRSTGAVAWSDVTGELLRHGRIVISWDEDAIGLGVEGESETAAQGGIVELPYNIEVSESHSPDMAGVEYIGRLHPVGAYGTQLGESSRLQAEIAKDDIETLDALRRLARLMRDAYVRDPTGNGYYAMVKVSMSTGYGKPSVSVSLDVTRTDSRDECEVI